MHRFLLLEWEQLLADFSYAQWYNVQSVRVRSWKTGEGGRGCYPLFFDHSSSIFLVARNSIVIITTYDHHKATGLSIPFWDRCEDDFACSERAVISHSQRELPP